MTPIDIGLAARRPEGASPDESTSDLRPGDETLSRTLELGEAQALAAAGKNPSDYCTLLLPAVEPPRAFAKQPDGTVLMQIVVALPPNVLRSVGQRSALTDAKGAAQARNHAQLGLPPYVRMTVRIDAIEIPAREELLASLAFSAANPEPDDGESVG